MELLSVDRTHPFSNEGKQNQIVNEQDQQEKVNPSGQDSPNSIEDNQKNTEANSSVKTNQSEIEMGSKYKDGQDRSNSELQRN